MGFIDRLHLEKPFYGARKIAVVLSRSGHKVGRKRVTRLMRLMGIETVYRKPNLSRRHPQHKIYPYLLRNVAIDRVHQVWSCDITYIPMKLGFLYLVAVIDWHSRLVLSWQLSNTMDKTFCVEALQDAFDRYGKPEIFNSDQGVQFTCEAFITTLSDQGIRISMDGKGRCLDNIFCERLWRSLKYEEVVCCERNRSHSERGRCFTKDEGGPLEVGLQEQTSNRHELHRLRASVVNVDGKRRSQTPSGMVQRDERK